MTVPPDRTMRGPGFSVSRLPWRHLFLLPALLLCLLAGTLTEAAAATVFVPPGGDLQAAINAAQPGDTIIVQAGATYVGSYLLPQKSGDAYVTIQSSRAAELPAPGRRVGPQHAPLMAKLASPGFNQPTLWTAPGAHHYRFVGLEITLSDASAFVTTLVSLDQGDDPRDAPWAVPHHVTIDRCYLHGLPDYSLLRRAIALNSAHTEILGSYISEIHTTSFESQAICGWNGPGPFRIINNYIEASTENLMFGGADPSITGLVPSDIEIRRNHFYKPPAWRGVWLVKNLLELKNAQRVTIDGNVFENNWAGGQSGYAIVLTPRNDSGRAPQSTVRDVAFTNNIVRNTPQFIGILGADYIHPSQRTERITIANNLLDAGTESGGWFMLLSLRDGGPLDLRVEHNTVITAGDVFYTTSDGSTETAGGFVFRNNVVTGALVSGDNNTGWGIHTLNQRFPGYIFARNVLANPHNWPAYVYPADTALPASAAEIGFTDPASGNYRLRAGSPYKNAATDGKDIGCDFDQLAAAINDTAPAPTPSPTPAPTPAPSPAQDGILSGRLLSGSTPLAGRRVIIYGPDGVDPIGSAITNFQGRYGFEANAGQRVVIRPETAAGLTFSPARYDLTATGDRGDLDFVSGSAPTPTPTPAPTPAPAPAPTQGGIVGGRLLSASTPLGGRRVFICDGEGVPIGSAITDSLGNYGFEVNGGQQVIIRPDTAGGISFSPAQYAFTASGGRNDLTFVANTSASLGGVLDGEMRSAAAAWEAARPDVERTGAKPFSGGLLAADGLGMAFEFAMAEAGPPLARGAAGDEREPPPLVGRHDLWPAGFGILLAPWRFGGG